MSHYFSKDNDNLKSNEKSVYAVINKIRFSFTTDIGVFSKLGLDFGSRLLIESILNHKARKVLDLGCGYGPIGIILSYFWSEATILGIDINERAVKLANKNAKLNNINNFHAVYGDGIGELAEKFDLIVTNPPIRAGKKVIYSFFTEAADKLNDNGSLVFVMNKKQGALSAIKKCETVFSNVDVLDTKSGYMIIECKNIWLHCNIVIKY